MVENHAVVKSVGGWGGALDEGFEGAAARVKRLASQRKGSHRLGVALVELGGTLRGVC